MKLWRCCIQYASKSGKLSGSHRTGKGQFSFQSQRKAMPKNALFSHVSKVMLKILQARLQQYVNLEFPDGQAGFRKDRGTRDQIVDISWIIETAREFQKNIYFCFIDYVEAFVWITTNCGKFLKRWEYQTNLLVSWETYMQVLKQQIRTTFGMMTGSKSGKEYIKAVYCHPAYLTSMQSTSCKMLGWIKHELESRLPGETSITSDMHMTPPLWQKPKRN